MSKEAKHTPGEWEILKGPCDDNDEYEVYVGVQYPNHCPKHVARVYGHGADYHNDPEMQANARLIASAPEMAEALRKAANRIEELWRWVIAVEEKYEEEHGMGSIRELAHDAPLGCVGTDQNEARDALRKAGLL